ARKAGLTRNPAECAARRSCVRRIQCGGVVQHVVELRTELNPMRFVKGETLQQRQVPGIENIRPNSRQSKRKLPQVRAASVPRALFESSVDIEPPVHRALVSGQRNVLNVACEDDIAKSDGQSTLELPSSTELPTSGEEI